eukprot:TRINITY_DN1147_c0_g2_i1.p1 TRINITY_DN1147_c0_g2~~TRINITY_DN1147_c0_g2_i1.p1  ORF type:complete len:152 (+),score=43.24 TRINITY_DN1147_c0_g2_i1:68-457(+)
MDTTMGEPFSLGTGCSDDKTSGKAEQRETAFSLMTIQGLTDSLGRMRVRSTEAMPRSKEQQELCRFLSRAKCERCRLPCWKQFYSRGATRNALLLMDNRARQQLFTNLCMPMHERMCLTSFLNMYGSIR